MIRTISQQTHAVPEKDNQQEQKPFLWDNWVVDVWDGAKPVLGRFALEAPWDPEPLTRHGNAHVALYMPSKAGDYRKFCDVTDKKPTWSGSALNLSALGRAEDIEALNWGHTVDQRTDEDFAEETVDSLKDTALLVAYTSRVEEHVGKDGFFAPQSLSLCCKPKGQLSFDHHEGVLNPYDLRDPNLRYYKLDDSHHVLSAWRDPFVCFFEGQYHMLFASRYSSEFYQELPEDLRTKHRLASVHVEAGPHYDPEVNSTVGHATSTDLKTWQLSKPLFLPGNATQFELPTLTQVHDGYVLSVAVSNGSVSITDPARGEELFGPRHQYPLMFKLTGTLDRMAAPDAWKALDRHINKATHPLAQTYGLTFKAVDDSVYATAYHEKTFTLTPVVKLARQAFPFNLPREDDACWWTPQP